MRKLGQVTPETVCYLESVFIVTLLEGMKTTATNARAYRDLPHTAESGHNPPPV